MIHILNTTKSTLEETVGLLRMPAKTDEKKIGGEIKNLEKQCIERLRFTSINAHSLFPFPMLITSQTLLSTLSKQRWKEGAAGSLDNQ